MVAFLLVSESRQVGPALGQQTSATDSPPRPERIISDWKELESWDDTLRSYRVEARDIYKENRDIYKEKARESDTTVPTLIRKQPNWRLQKRTYGEITTVFARSSRYAFFVSQKKPGSPWSMKHLTMTPLTPEARAAEKNSRGLLASSPLSSFDGDETLYALTHEPKFKITRISPQADGLVKVEFQWQPKQLLYKGVAITNPKLSSVVLECSVHGPTPSGGVFSSDLKRELSPSDPKHPIPQCKFVQISSRNPFATEEHTYRFSDYSYAPLPEEDFRLSTYGLPEPVGMEVKKGIPNYVWIIAAAIGCALLAFGFRFLARRRRKDPSPRGAP